ncbi:MAG: D-amino acid aminotransferase [Bacillota bacterium]
MPELWYLNGSYISKEEAKVSVLDRGFLFGDGLYEVVRVYDNEPFCLSEHLDRFYFGVKGIGLPFPYSKDEFDKIIRKVIKDSNLGGASVYWEVTRGTYDPRTHYVTAKMTTPNIFIQSKPAAAQPEERRQNGIMVSLQPDIRWLKCCYKTVNLLPNCLASTKAHDKGGFEAVLYRDQNHVTEGASSSFFIVKNGELWTHPEGDLILSSITRGEIKKLCAKNGIPFVEKIFSVKDALTADEAFTSGTVVEINPAVRIDENVVGDGKVGPVTKKIMDLYLKASGQR